MDRCSRSRIEIVLRGFALAAFAALPACGGGGCHDIWCAGPVLEMRWQSDPYTFTTPASSAEAVSFDTTIEVSGWGVFEGLKLDITHADWGSNPTTSTYATVMRDPAAGAYHATVQMLVSAEHGAGTYPKGSYKLVATSGFESVAPIDTTIVLK